MKSNRGTARVNNCAKLKVSGSVESPKFICFELLGSLEATNHRTITANKK